MTAQNTDALKREVQTREIAATYKTQYRYGRYRNGYNICACKKCGENVDSRAEWTYQTSAWLDSPVSLDTSYDYSWPANSSHNHKDVIYTNYSSSEGIYRDHWYRYVVNGAYYYFLDSTRQVVDTAAYTQYRYRDTTYVHKFYKWNNWSDWSDSFRSGDATDTRTLYRYRDRSISGDIENTDGETYAVEGNINCVESDFSGLTASIMVYRKCNTDPTEEQLEYVGATTIGENNSYSFSFMPKENPSQETGDYIVALGIEGADRLVNVETIKADVPKYQVKFVVDGEVIYDDNAQGLVDSDGNSYRAQLVEENGTAIAPELPEKAGYAFVKWSETLTGIKTNKVITAEYVPNEYSIVFIDWDTNSITTQKLKYGDPIIYPALTDVEGVTSRGWNKQEEGITTVTDNMIIETVSQLKEYDVSFEYDGNVISTQKVKYGKSAEIPEDIPQKEGMVFAEWTGNCSSKYITEDAVFTPVFVYENTVAMPVATVVNSDVDGTKTIELTCDTDGAQIYYIKESHDEMVVPEQHTREDDEILLSDYNISLFDFEEIESEGVEFKAIAIPYTEPIIVNDDESIVFVAYADGMNESIPVIESNDGNSNYYPISVKTNTLRRYWKSLEGDISLEILNELPEYEFGTVTLCFYDDRGVLIDIIPNNIEIVPGENIIEFKDINIENALVQQNNNITCKVISWMSGDGVQPITDVLEINLK